MKIEIKNRFSGEVIFSHDQENNSVKITVELAVREKADLHSANLRSADLRYANLRYADLRSADLSYANLRSANLRYANLRFADLRFADLSYADLSYADLRSADLRSADLGSADLICYGDMKFIFTMQLDSWPIGFTKDTLQIECQKHPIDDWRNFSDEQIEHMDSNALAWWKKWKAPLLAIIDERIKDL